MTGRLSIPVIRLFFILGVADSENGEMQGVFESEDAQDDYSNCAEELLCPGAPPAVMMIQ